MAYVISVTPGFTFKTDGTDKTTYSKLNMLGVPLITITGSVGAADIDSNAVTTAKIANDAVTSSKIADEAVLLAHLQSTGIDIGSILHRGASGWEFLAPGALGEVLTGKGAGNPIEFSAIPALGSIAISQIVAGSPNTHLITNGSGNLAWSTETALSFVTFREEQASGTASGTFSNGAAQVRVLTNLTDHSSIGASLAANQITLPAGTYHARITCPAHKVVNHVASLYDTTGAATLLTGSSANGYLSGAQASTVSVIEGVFTLSGISVLEVKHQCSTTVATNGLGTSHSIAGTVEIFTQGTFIKLS